VGNPVAAIDETQGVVATRDTLAYGSEQTHTGNPAAFGDLGFTGQIDRSNNQIVYFNARYYLPQLRRFASPDSVTVVDGGFNHIDRYSYAYANPYLYNDPTGNWPENYQVVNPFSIIFSSESSFWSDYGTMLDNDLVQSGAMSKGLSETSRWSGHVGAGLAASVIGAPFGIPLLKMSAVTGAVSAAWDWKFHDNNVNGMSYMAGEGFSFIQTNAVKMLPYPMKTPADAYFFTMDRLVQEGFYHVGNE
jgi:RHS repeat-associated protein